MNENDSWVGLCDEDGSCQDGIVSCEGLKLGLSVGISLGILLGFVDGFVDGFDDGD